MSNALSFRLPGKSRITDALPLQAANHNLRSHLTSLHHSVGALNRNALLSDRLTNHHRHRHRLLHLTIRHHLTQTTIRGPLTKKQRRPRMSR
jgi:hypothetical protein